MPTACIKSTRLRTLTRIAAALIAFISAVSTLHAAEYLWTTFAGVSGGEGSIDGVGSAARFNYPRGVCADPAGNLYVADYYNDTIRKVKPDGTVTTFAGLAGINGTVNGTALSARFSGPSALAFDAAGNLFVADSANSAIRKITPSGIVTTFAGLPGVQGTADGSGTAARFRVPIALAFSRNGDLYVADQLNYIVRKISPAGEVSTVAGSAGNYGSADGNGSNARFASPQGIAVDSANNVFVADTNNRTIRKISPNGDVTTFVGLSGSFGSTDGSGNSARFYNPTGLAIDSTDTLYVADTNNYTVRKVTAEGVVTTIAGFPGSAGSSDGSGHAAAFGLLQGICVDQNGNIFVGDSTNHIVRKITPGAVVSTLAGEAPKNGTAEGVGASARFHRPLGITVADSNTLYVLDSANHAVRRVTADGAVSNFAGTPGNVAGFTDGFGLAAYFYGPSRASVDKSGNLFVADTNAHTIRKVSPAGAVTTFAGAAFSSGTTDGTGSARFNTPLATAVSPDGDIFVADRGNYTIRRITPAGAVSTFAGMAGMSGMSDGSGASVRFRAPSDLAFDSEGNLFVADDWSSTIRKITPSGVVSTFAGLGGASGTQDGTGTAARFRGPEGLCIDDNNNIFVADSDSHTIRMISPGGVVSTIGGVPGVSGARDGYGGAALLSRPRDVAVSSNGILYVTDTNNNRVVRGLPQIPDIAVDHPANTTLSDGVSNMDFGLRNPGSSFVKTVGLRNDGFVDLTGLAVSIDGANASEFTSSSLEATTLPPGGSTQFSVTFTAGGVGARTATLHIASNDPDEASFDVDLMGIGNAPPTVTLLGGSPYSVGMAGAYSDPGALASDVDDGPLSPRISSNSVIPHIPGTYQVTWAATDSLGLESFATRTVIVSDTSAPVLSGSFAPVLLVADATNHAALPDYTEQAVAVDNVAVVSKSQSPLAGSLLPAGSTSIKVFAFDAAGNRGEVTFAIQVRLGNADQATVGMVGDEVPGAGSGRIPEGAKWTRFGVPVVNGVGDYAYLGKWSSSAGVGAGIFKFSAGVAELLAQVGDEVLPGVTVKSFREPLMDENGEVAVIVRLEGEATHKNDSAILKIDAGGVSLIAREGDPAPGQDDAYFSVFKRLSVRSQEVLFSAALRMSSGARRTKSSIWSHSGSYGLESRLVQGDFLETGLSSGTGIKEVVSFRILAPVAGLRSVSRTHPKRDVAMALVLFKGGTRGLASLSHLGPVVRRFTGDSVRTEHPEWTWYSFGIPAATSATDFAVLGTLRNGTDKQPAIVAGALSDQRVVVRPNMPAPDLRGNIMFKNFGHPVYSNGSIAFRANLSGRGVSARNRGAIYAGTSQDIHLVARAGDIAPEAFDGTYKAFTSVGLFHQNSASPLWVAQLAGPGVNQGNDVALFARNSVGTPRLIIREGEPLMGKTVSRFDAMPLVSDSPDFTRSFNEAGDICIRVHFKGGSQAIVLFRVP